MTALTRRAALRGVGAVVAVAAVAAPAVQAANPEEAQVQALFRQLSPARQDVSFRCMQALLDVQNEINTGEVLP